MSKFHCPCGWVISDVTFPSYQKHHVISDSDLDALINYSKDPVTIDADGFDDHERDMLECSQCGRLHLQNEPKKNYFMTYAKEVDADAHVVKLEAALAQLLWTGPSDPGYDEARAQAEKLLKR